MVIPGYSPIGWSNLDPIFPFPEPQKPDPEKGEAKNPSDLLSTTKKTAEAANFLSDTSFPLPNPMAFELPRSAIANSSKPPLIHKKKSTAKTLQGTFPSVRRNILEPKIKKDQPVKAHLLEGSKERRRTPFTPAEWAGRVRFMR